MSVKEYTNENGELRFLVRVIKKSSVEKSIMIDKKVDEIESEAEALKIEKNLISQASKEIAHKELQGSSWENLLLDWEEALMKGDGIQRKVSFTTAEDYIKPLYKYTSGWLKKPVSQISKADIRVMLKEMDTFNLAPSRKKKILFFINQAFSWGIEVGKIKHGLQSPARGIKFDKEDEKRPEILTLNQIKSLIKASRELKHPCADIWIVALLTGMRSGELHELRWSDLDFENNVVHLQRSFNSRLNIVKSTKSAYWRDIPMNEDLKELLYKLKASCQRRDHVFPRMKDWDNGEMAQILRTFCVGIGIPPVRFHTLRACFATMLLREKVAPAVVMKICGWKELKTMQRYIRLAGIEVTGATDSLRLIPPEEAMGTVVQLFN